MFVFKKILGALFSPLAFSALILLLGFLYLQFRRTQRKGKFLVFCGIVLILLFGYQFTAERFLRTLENRYPPVGIETLAQTKPPIKWIAVLGGGHVPDPRLPATGRLSESASARLIEAVRLHRQLPGSKLILSGGAVYTRVDEAQVMAEAAAVLNVKPEDIVLEQESRDTEDQAVRIREIVGKDRFVLVTSAAHMPRSMALFKKAGLEPIPAPAHFLAPITERQIEPKMFFPDAENLRKSEIAVHEYLGILWAKIRGKM